MEKYVQEQEVRKKLEEFASLLQTSVALSEGIICDYDVIKKRREEFTCLYRPVFLKGLCLFYGKELSACLSEEQMAALKNGFSPNGWTCHHLRPFHQGGGNLSSSFLKKNKEIIRLYKNPVTWNDYSGKLEKGLNVMAFIRGSREKGIYWPQQKERFDAVFANIVLMRAQEHRIWHVLENGSSLFFEKKSWRNGMPSCFLRLAPEKPFILSQVSGGSEILRDEKDLLIRKVQSFPNRNDRWIQDKIKSIEKRTRD